MKRPLLLPLVPLYAAGVALREMRLERGWEKVRRLRWPVIGVGNLSTGGSGKTPLVIALARLLTGRGFHVDVLSRGYGRTGRGAARVRPDGRAEEFGDEPLLIAREAGVPVYVAAERFEAGQLAEEEWAVEYERALSAAKAQSFPGDVSARVNSCPDREPCSSLGNVHILDDGFQHRQLARDVDVVLVNREDLHDTLLPAGNLRESLGALNRATVLAIPADDLEVERFFTEMAPIDRNSEEPRWIGPLWRIRRRMEVPQVDGSVAAFCGIARPEQFFAGLEAAGLRVVLKKAFRDHYEYTEEVLDWLAGKARSAGATALITTEKDAVRIGRLASKLQANLPLKTAGLRVEIGEEAAAMEWIGARLSGAGLSPAL
jgi:tetraacyldisaccharide 4'-kinase